MNRTSAEHEISDTIGHRLERVRRMEGVSQGKFCEILGISRTSLQNYVRGDRDIPISVLATLLEQYAVDPIWMMYGDESDVGMRHKADILAEIRNIGIALERRAEERRIVLSVEERWRLVSQIYTAHILQSVRFGERRAAEHFLVDSMLESYDLTSK
ncbi:helix-turn-helix domain-containing protein [Paracoccaceae bacterium GXU_MW_L88]